MNEREADKVFANLLVDGNGGGELLYTQFMAAAMQSRFQMQEFNIREAFQKFDHENSGMITVDNLRDVLGDEFDGIPVEDIINQIDSTGTKTIDYSSFCQVLQQNALDGGDSPTSPRKTLASTMVEHFREKS